MPEYRRYFVEGGTYFFTLVTALLSPIRFVSVPGAKGAYLF